jgi:hypothetical protein
MDYYLDSNSAKKDAFKIILLLNFPSVYHALTGNSRLQRSILRRFWWKIGSWNQREMIIKYGIRSLPPSMIEPPMPAWMPKSLRKNQIWGPWDCMILNKMKIPQKITIHEIPNSQSDDISTKKEWFTKYKEYYDTKQYLTSRLTNLFLNEIKDDIISYEKIINNWNTEFDTEAKDKPPSLVVIMWMLQLLMAPETEDDIMQFIKFIFNGKNSKHMQKVAAKYEYEQEQVQNKFELYLKEIESNDDSFFSVDMTLKWRWLEKYNLESSLSSVFKNT